MTKNNQKGFSLIEVMISIGILSTVVMFSMNYLEAQRKNSDRLNKQAARKSLAIQLAEEISKSYIFTPPMTTVGKNAYYVNCYNKSLQPALNKHDNRDPALVFLAGTNPELTITDMCLYKNGSRFQSVFWWDTTGTPSVILRLFEITQTGLEERSVMYKISF